MILQVISLLILTLFSVFNLFFILSPLLFLIAFILLGSDFLPHLKIISLTILLISFIFLAFIYVYEIFMFYTTFRIKNRLKRLAYYTETVYKEMVDVFVEELLANVKMKEGWLSFYILNDPSIKIFSFANSRQGVIVFSVGVMEKLIEVVKEDSDRALKGFEFIIGHELSHIQNEHFISSDFFTSNVWLGIYMKSIYKNIFKIISKVLYLIPFAGKILTMLFPFINQFIDFIFSISGKLFEFAYKSIRATLFQIQETQADKESALIFGNDTMKIFFEEFPPYSNAFSVHNVKRELRLKRFEAMEKNPETTFVFSEERAEVLITCYTILLILIIPSLVFLSILLGRYGFLNFLILLQGGLGEVFQIFYALFIKLQGYALVLKQIFF
jgi:Zn-dependent protease with chaperone function